MKEKNFSVFYTSSSSSSLFLFLPFLTTITPTAITTTIITSAIIITGKIESFSSSLTSVVGSNLVGSSY